MAELGITIAEKLIEVTASAIIKEICEMWGYKSQLEDLNKTVCTIKNVLLDAESKREELSHEARGYIAELKAVVYDADDLFDEFITLAELKLIDGNKDDKFLKKVRRFFSSKKKGVSQARRMSRQVKDIKAQLDTIVSNHHKFGLSFDYKPICRRREETCSHVNAKGIIGREGDKKSVIDMLLGPDNNNDVDESFRFVTIVGVGGLGKTALAQLVYNDEKVKVDFPQRLWVCVSDQDGELFDVTKILFKIIELVTDDHKLYSNSTPERVQRKFQELIKGKKYLLVLDDVWNEGRKEWDSLKNYLIMGQEGSRIVVTTRSDMTAKIIGEKHTHKLEGLSKENSWLLFESVAFNKEEKEHINNPDLVDFGKKIVRRCNNTPLAIKVVGSLLYGQPVDKWQTFEHSGLSGIGNGDNEIMSILKLSYHNLRSSLKNCFSYCAMFPKDYPMKRKQLINLWMAHGYIVPLDRDQSIEHAAEEHFLILVRRCFFQNVEKDKYGDIVSVKMHDLMHDVALEVGREDIGVVSSNTTELGDNVRHLHFAGGTFSQSYLFMSKIRSLIVRIRVDGYIDSLMRLRVLCLRSVDDKGLFDLIGKLLHLRYLDLSHICDLVALPSFTLLHNLQTLDLNNCTSLRELPKDFSKLEKLRYLDLSCCTKLTDMPCMDNLTSLVHLNLHDCCNLSSLPLGMDTLTSLSHFDLSSCSSLKSIPTSICKLKSLMHFDLRRCTGLTSMPRSMDQLTCLRHLNLSGCSRLSSIPTSMGQLTCLRNFDLSGCISLTSMPTSIGQLISLRHFDISHCDELSNMPSGMGKLSNLRVLPLFVVGMKKRVSSDEEQCRGELKDLKPLTNLIGGIKIKIGKYYMNDDGEGGYLKSMKHLTRVGISFDRDGCLECEGVMGKLDSPPNLKYFSLRHYKGRIIPRWGRAQDNWGISFKHLVEIEFNDCDNLEQIPQLSKLQFLVSLTLNSLRKLEYVEIKSRNNGNERREELMTFFPSLKYLNIYFLDSLKGWWREELVEDDDNDECILRSSFTFPSLLKLYIRSCPNLTSFPSSTSLKKSELNDVGLLNLHSHCLTSLNINHYHKLESVSEFRDVFRECTSSLQRLEISSCQNLRRLGRGGLEHLTALVSLKLSHNHQLSFCEDQVDGDGMPWKSLHHCLRSLKLGWLKNMKSLPKGLKYLTSLRSLTIENCENLRGLPEWISCLSSLQSLSIERCRAMKSLPESMRNLTSLQKLVIINCSDELAESCEHPNGKDWPKIQHIPNKLLRLHYLKKSKAMKAQPHLSSDTSSDDELS